MLAVLGVGAVGNVSTMHFITSYPLWFGRIDTFRLATRDQGKKRRAEAARAANQVAILSTLAGGALHKYHIMYIYIYVYTHFSGKLNME